MSNLIALIMINRTVVNVSSVKIGNMIFITEFFHYADMPDLFVSVWHAGAELCVIREEELILFAKHLDTLIRSFCV